MHSITTPQTIRASLQACGTSDGNPTGTILGATNNGFGAVASPASNTWYNVTLGESVAVTAGDPLAMVFDWPGTQGLLFLTVPNQWGQNGQPYVSRFTSSWQTKLSQIISAAVRYTSGAWPLIGHLPMLTATGNQTYNHSNSPSEYGNAIVLPFNARAVGAWWMGNPTINADAYTINLYSGTTVLSTYTGNPEITAGTNAAFRNSFFAPVTLAAGSTYYLGLTPNPSTATTVTLYGTAVSAAAHLGAWPGGTNVYQCSRTGSGAWSTLNTTRMAIGLLLDQVDAGGGGGNLINQGEY